MVRVRTKRRPYVRPTAECLERRALLTGSITGTAYEDLDADGQYNPAVDRPIRERTVFIDANNDGQWRYPEVRTVTASDGTYTLSGLAPGATTVRQLLAVQEVAAPGAGARAVTVVDLQTVAGVNLGIVSTVPNASVVAGRAYIDTDGDGAYTSGDPSPSRADVYANVLIYADLNANGDWDASEPYTKPDTGSAFYHLRLPAGTAATTVRIKVLVVSPDIVYDPIDPVGGYDLPALPPGVRPGSHDFRARVKTPIDGYVFDDVNANGSYTNQSTSYDIREADLAARIVYVDLDEDGQLDPGEPSTLTDVLGEYRLLVYPGTYVVRQVLPAGWTQTAPRDGGGIAKTVNPSGARLIGHDFGSIPAVRSTFSVNFVGTEGNLATAAFTQTQGAGPFTYSFDFDNDGSFDAVGTSPSATLPSAMTDDGAPGRSSPAPRVTDAYTGLSSDYLAWVYVSNAVDLGTVTYPKNAPEGSTGRVVISAVVDKSSADRAAGYRFDYDFDGDGTYDLLNTTSMDVDIPAALLADGPKTYPKLQIRVYDKDGSSVKTLPGISVAGVGPSATLTVPATVYSAVAFTASFSDPTDPSAADAAAGYRYSFDFDNNGTFDVVDSTSPSVTYTYAAFIQGGPYTIRARIKDKDGSFTDTLRTVNVVGAPFAGIIAPNYIDESAPNPAYVVQFVGATGLAPFTYSVDFDGDGVDDVVDSPDPVVPIPPRFYADGDRLLSIRHRVKDARGFYGARPQQFMHVYNRMPEVSDITVTGAVASGTATITLNVTDGPADLAAGLRYSYSFHDPFSPGATDIVDSPSSVVTHAYPRSGVYDLTVIVKDKDGAVNYSFYTVTVANVAPTATFHASVTGEGSIGVFYFRDQEDTAWDSFTYSYDLDGDGVFEIAGVTDSEATHYFPDSGTFTLRGRITDQDGASSTYEATVTVRNYGPQADVTVTSPPEGQPAILTIANVTDRSPVDTAAGFLYDVDFDSDGTWEVVGSSLATISHTFPDSGRHSITTHVRDKDGEYSTYVVYSTVTNVAPVATFADLTVTAGTPAAIGLTGVYDPSPDDTAHLRFDYDLDGDGTFEFSSTSPTRTTTYPAPGSHPVRVRVSDPDGGASVYTATVTIVLPPPPVAVFSSGGTVDEGSPGSVSFAAPSGAGPFTYAYDFDGNGTFEIAGSAATLAVVPAEHLADGPFTRTVRGRITDRFGQWTDYTAGIVVRNVAPTLAIPAAAGGSVVLGTRYTLSLGSFDPGRDGVTSWRVAWDDGTTSDLHAATGVVGHDYAAAGVYHVTITATDDDGSYTESRSVAVTAAPPVAAFAAGALAGGGSAYTFTVTYGDNIGIDTTTLSDGDFQIVGPAGTSLARLVSIAAGPGNSVVATYAVPSPLGTWLWQDSGSYAVLAREGEVRNLPGIPLAAGEVGAFSIALSPPALPDLVGAFAGPAPKTLSPGDKGTMAVRVSNRGAKAAPAATWTTRLYLSTDGTIDPADVLVGASVQKGVALPINGSKSYTIPYAVPKGIAGGQYRLLMQVDATGTVAERDERNNVVAAPGLVPVVTPSADLSTSFATKLKPTYKPGESMALGLKVTNAGPSEANGTAAVRFFFSEDPVLDSGDRLVLTSALSLKLKAKASAVFNKTVKLPAGMAPGKWYVLAVTDGTSVGDRNAANNVASAQFRI